MSNIDRIEVRAVGPDVKRFKWGELPEQYATLIIVRIFDKDGLEGIGATPAYSSGQFDISILETLRPLVPRLLGEEALSPEALWYKLHDYVLPQAPGAISAIDIALWDISAKRAQMPLYQLLGGARRRMPAYASTELFDSVSAYVDSVYELREMGFGAVKFHAWNIPERDLEMLRAVHAQHRDSGMTFMHDAEQRYDRVSALRVAREVDEMGLRWLEAPLNDFDLEGYRELRRRVKTPILPAGNSILDIHAVAEALRGEPWDALRFDVAVAGGITSARKLVGLAHAHGMSAELQSWGNTLIQAANLHAALGLERSSYFELPVPYEPNEYGVLNHIRPTKDGFVEAPTGPGLGIEVDWEQMAASTIASFTIKTGDVAS
jgi:L-alanine-DL-glutamate epimerase-like enolase superfamily enzyme